MSLWEPVNLRYYSDRVREGLVYSLVIGITAGGAMMLGVHAIRLLLLPILPLGPVGAWVIAGIAGVVTLLAVFLWHRLPMFRPWCLTCRKRVAMRERMIGIPATRDTLMNPTESEVIRSLARGDWSPLHDAQPLQWKESLPPAVLIGLGRCEACQGPFIVFGEIRGKDAATNTIYAGTAFISEVNEDSAEALLATAHQRGLMRP